MQPSAAIGSVPRSASFDRTAIAGAGALALCVAIVFATALTAATPIFDSALFQIVGRSLAGGATLYRDVWDNKLPGIFAVNALWSLLFGDRAVARAVAEAGIDLLSVALFARLLMTERVRTWAIGAAALGILTALLGYANDTEHYAVPLLLAAVLGLRSRRDAGAVAAGVCIALAASFWIPSVFVLAIAFAGRRRTFALAASAMLVTAIAGAAAFAAWFGIDVSRELIASWTSYLGGESVAARFADIRGVALPLTAIALLSAGGAACALRVRATARGRCALLWIGAMWAGGLLPMHPFVHYFLPAVPAAIFGIAVSGIRLRPRAAALAALAAVVIAVADMAHAHRTADSESARVARAGAIVQRALGADRTLWVDVYEPGLYLSAGARVRDRFELAAQANAPFVAMRKGTRVRAMMAAYRNDADVYVQTFARTSRAALPGRTEVCARAVAPWHLYVKSALAGAFERCSIGGPPAGRDQRTRIAQPAGGNVAGTAPAANAMSPVSP